MLQNFKADIIYYNTPTDFELEFNLCGCCRMRLLNDKCDDKKTLLMSLSRAFSRSRVIILTAPLFDGSNIISTISTAIGSGTQTINPAEFNIHSEMPIEITKGSLPLVTSDGIFAGCIIESGPQTLIILTDNKSVRKNVMKDLIHPYIEELSGSLEATSETPDNQETAKTEEVTEPVENQEPSKTETVNEPIVETEQPPKDETPSEEIKENEVVVQNPNDLILDSPKEKETANDIYYYAEGNELYTETKKDSKKSQQEDSDDSDYYENEYYIEERPEEKNQAFNIALIVICAVLLLTIAVLCFCIFFIPAQNETTPALYLKEIFDTMFK